MYIYIYCISKLFSIFIISITGKSTSNTCISIVVAKLSVDQYLLIRPEMPAHHPLPPTPSDINRGRHGVPRWAGRGAMIDRWHTQGGRLQNVTA